MDCFKYPERPWQDGQEVTKKIGGKDVVVARYILSKNLWEHLNMNDDGSFYYTTACQVQIDFEECPCPTLRLTPFGRM